MNCFQFFHHPLLVIIVLFGASARPVMAESYAHWLAAHSLPSDASGAGGLMAAPAGDGIANLLKFALDLDPAQRGYSDRFATGTTADGGADFLSLTFTRPSPPRPGIAYDVELASALSTWGGGGVLVSDVTAGSYETITTRDAQPIGGMEARRFIRLKITVTATVPANSVLPQITGTPQVGQTLAATTGTWSGGSDTPVYFYQWTRNGADIPSATGPAYQATAADLGATLAVRVTGMNIAGSTAVLAAGIGPVTAAFPTVAVRADGYTAELSFANLAPGGTYALTPDTTPKVLMTVTSPGFDDAGAATTLTREIVGTVALRQPHPNHTSATETTISGGVRITIALSDRVHAGDTITQCGLLAGAYTSASVASPSATLTATGGTATNASTLPFPKAIANWLAFPRERAVSGATHHEIELLAFHRFARNGRQVACVEFIATDEHANTVSVKTSAMVQSTRVTTGNPIAVYRGSIPLATLTQGDHVTVRTKVHPFVGNGAAVLDSDPSADGAPATVPSGFANHIFLNDKTGAYGTAYAYVSPTGSDATGVASGVAATSAANPFLTIYAAAVAVKARNNAVHAHNDLGGGVVRLTAGSYAGFGATSLNALGAGRTWFTIEAAPGEGVASVTLEPGTRKNPGNWVKFRNLAFTPNAASHTVLDAVDDGAVDGPPVLYGAYEGLRIHGTSGPGNAPIIYRVGLRHFIGCEMKDLGRSLNATFGANREHTPLLAGCTLSYTTQVATGGLATPTWTSVGNILSKGFYFTDPATTAGTGPGTTRVVAPKGGILAFNSAHGSVTTHTFGFKQPIVTGGGLAIVQNVFELITNTSSPCFSVAADGGVMAMDNVVVQHLSVVGARTNYLYNDVGTVAVPKNGTFAFSILNQYNCKTDTFDKPGEGPNGARIGNWEPHHGVGQAGNVHQNPAANGPVAPYTGPTSWNGMYLGRSVKVAGTAGYLSDLSLTGANTGGGNYRIGAASDARNRVPAGLATLPFDLDGVARRNDGTGAAGGYEF